MQGCSSNDAQHGTLRSWAIVIGISLSFVIWGLFLYASIGDKGSPPWDYSIVQDIPGESSFSTRSRKLVPGGLQDKEVVRQHVMGPRKDSAKAPGEEKP